MTTQVPVSCNFESLLPAQHPASNDFITEWDYDLQSLAIDVPRGGELCQASTPGHVEEVRKPSKPPSSMTLHLCTLCTSSSTIFCLSFSSANKTSEIERPQWKGEPFTWNADCYLAAAFASHSPNLRSWLSRGVGWSTMPPKRISLS